MTASKRGRGFSPWLFVMGLLFTQRAEAQHVRIDTSDGARRQTIDGFGTALNELAEAPWFAELFFADLGATIVRWDMSPRFVSPYSDALYYTPWFDSGIPFPGPDGNNARTYTGPEDYQRSFAGFSPPIAVMGPDIDQNVLLFDVQGDQPYLAGLMAQAGQSHGEVNVLGTIFSPAPWLKVASGGVFNEGGGVLPGNGTPFPFVWNGNFGGGILDVSNEPLEVFFDGVEDTSALTQFARSTAAYLRAFQDAYGVQMHAIGIQNELNFEHYFWSCKYPQADSLIAALKVLRAELDKYPDLSPIRIIGPEDLLIDTPYALWQFGGGATLTHKNLRFLDEIATDPLAFAALDFFAVHGAANEQAWRWWADGWTSTPAGSLPSQVDGFRAYGKKSWMTETSGHESRWPVPPAAADDGALGVALAVHRALTDGQESAWLHWQFALNEPAGRFALTDATLRANAPKYVAVKHFARFVRPGAARVEVQVDGAPSLYASAYVHDADETLTVVLINAASADRSMTFTVPTLPVGLWHMRSHTSDASAYLVEGDLDVRAGELASVEVPAYGMVTLVGTANGRTNVPDGRYRLRNRNSGLRAEALSLGAPPRLVQMPAHGGASQRFLITHVGEGRYTVGTNDGSLLWTAGAGPSVLLRAAVPDDTQRWTFRATPLGERVLENVATGLVLDVSQGLRTPGARLVQSAANDSASQAWQLVP